MKINLINVSTLAETLAESKRYVEYNPNGLLAGLRDCDIASAVANASSYVNDDVNAGTDNLEHNAIISNVSAAVIADINVFRNKITPVYNDYVESVNKLIEDNYTSRETNNYTIKEISLPAAFVELSNITTFADKPNGTIPIGAMLKVGAESPEDIRFRATSNTDISATSQEQLVSKYSNNRLVYLWDMYIATITSDSQDLNSLANNATINADDITLLYLLLLSLRRNAPDTIKSEKFISTMDAYISMVSVVMYKINTSYTRSVDNNFLVTAIIDDVIYVTEPVYQRYLAEDGTPEAVMGICFGSEPANVPIREAKISADIEKYTTLYNKQLILNRVALKEASYNIYLLSYINAIDNIKKEAPEEIASMFVNKDTVNADVEAWLRTKTMVDLNDIQTCSLHIISLILFNLPNYKLFTTNMLHYSKVGVNTTMQEAASLATLDMITDFVFTQFKITK